jgi:hypothetical protein
MQRFCLNWVSFESAEIGLLLLAGDFGLHHGALNLDEHGQAASLDKPV